MKLYKQQIFRILCWFCCGDCFAIVGFGYLAKAVLSHCQENIAAVRAHLNYAYDIMIVYADDDKYDIDANVSINMYVSK